MDIYSEYDLDGVDIDYEGTYPRQLFPDVHG